MPKVMASAMVAICTPARSWFTTFMTDPAPASSPMLKTTSAVASRIGAAASKLALLGSHDAELSPAAFTEPPDIGASR